MQLTDGLLLTEDIWSKISVQHYAVHALVRHSVVILPTKPSKQRDCEDSGERESEDIPRGKSKRWQAM